MKDLMLAAKLLKCGEIIAAPTDTVYGLLADATNESAIQKIYIAKKRPITKPLIVLVSSIEMAKEFALFDSKSEKIATRFWIDEKKPLTIILKAKNVSKLITAGGDTVALRLPKNDFCLELINGLGKAIVAPSANISGNNTATSYDMVKNDFRDSLPLIIDGGICENLPSTIIDLSSGNLNVIRVGAVSNEELQITKN